MTLREILSSAASQPKPIGKIAQRLLKLSAALRQYRAAWFAPFGAADEEVLGTYDARAW